MEKELLPQRMKDVLKVIGENSVLFHLFLMAARHETWNVYQNLSDVSCDLLLINSKNNNKIRIEVKTRQKLYTTAKINNNAQFILSNNEYVACDFLVGFWFEHGRYYVVPKVDLKSAKNKDVNTYKYAVVMKDENKYINNWSLIENEMIRLDQ